MKRAIRTLFLVVGLLCTYTAVIVPAFALDGAPPPYCYPGDPCR